MKSSYRIAIWIQLAAVTMFAQSSPHTYKGDIVNANCMQAARIVNRNSRGYVPPAGVSALIGSPHKTLRTAGIRKTILRHCAANPGTTVFALLDDDGNFFKLNETGNFNVLSQTPTKSKKVRVTISGFVDRDTLNVQSLR